MQRKTLNRHEKTLRFAEANMKAEGFSVTAKARRNCRSMLRGEVSGNRLVADYVTKYTQRIEI